MLLYKYITWRLFTFAFEFGQHFSDQLRCCVLSRTFNSDHLYVSENVVGVCSFQIDNNKRHHVQVWSVDYSIFPVIVTHLAGCPLVVPLSLPINGSVSSQVHVRKDRLTSVHAD